MARREDYHNFRRIDIGKASPFTPREVLILKQIANGVTSPAEIRANTGLTASNYKAVSDSIKEKVLEIKEKEGFELTRQEAFQIAKDIAIEVGDIVPPPPQAPT